eukprot:749604-Hanusia_phi.AAC.1
MRYTGSAALRHCRSGPGPGPAIRPQRPPAAPGRAGPPSPVGCTLTGRALAAWPGHRDRGHSGASHSDGPRCPAGPHRAIMRPGQDSMNR